MKKALITGITGQDGSYLAELLVEKGYDVVGITSGKSSRKNLQGLEDKITLVTGDISNESIVTDVLNQHKPDEIYNLASIATVSNPWDQVLEVAQIAGVTPLYFLEWIRKSSPRTRFFQASSAEMYALVKESPQSEMTPFHPQNPYGIAKLFAHQMVERYRDVHHVFAVSGILFNHESPRRPESFVTRKITSTLALIVSGSDEVLSLGNIDARRDWSFAGDFVQAMWMSLQHATPDTYIFASGESHTVREFIEASANALNMKLTWKGTGLEEKAYDDAGRIVVEIHPDFYRPVEEHDRRGDITKIKKELGWQPETSFEELVRMMTQADSASPKHQ